MTPDYEIASLDGYNAITVMVDPAAALEAAHRLEKATASCARRGGLSVRSALHDDDDDARSPGIGGRHADSDGASTYDRSSAGVPTRMATRFLAVRGATPR